jgi:hypothetical protein
MKNLAILRNCRSSASAACAGQFGKVPEGQETLRILPRLGGSFEARQARRPGVTGKGHCITLLSSFLKKRTKRLSLLPLQQLSGQHMRYAATANR